MLFFLRAYFKEFEEDGGCDLVLNIVCILKIFTIRMIPYCPYDVAASILCTFAYHMGVTYILIHPYAYTAHAAVALRTFERTPSTRRQRAATQRLTHPTTRQTKTKSYVPCVRLLVFVFTFQVQFQFRPENKYYLRDYGRSQGAVAARDPRLYGAQRRQGDQP